jgi:hypothetical protein
MSAHDCYVGVRPCGCVVAWVSFQSPKPELQRAVSQFIGDGLRVESRVTDDVRRTFGNTCDQCDAVKYQTDIFAQVAP